MSSCPRVYGSEGDIFPETGGGELVFLLIYSFSGLKISCFVLQGVWLVFLVAPVTIGQCFLGGC